MNKFLASKNNTLAGIMKKLTRSPNQFSEYNTKEKVTIIDEYKDCCSVWWCVRQQTKSYLPSFQPVVDMKTLMCIIYANDILSYCY